MGDRSGRKTVAMPLCGEALPSVPTLRLRVVESEDVLKAILNGFLKRVSFEN